jgi:hypothetical protein
VRASGRAAALALAAALGVWACAGGEGPDPAIREESIADLLAAKPEGQGGLPTLTRLADEFYRRMVDRRVNSIATYQDPGLREFFHSEESWADYYADLVQVLGGAHFEALRPTAVALVDVTLETPERALVRVRFTGENDRPLRWWETHLVREDRWERDAGRWWIIPGKL